MCFFTQLVAAGAYSLSALRALTIGSALPTTVPLLAHTDLRQIHTLTLKRLSSTLNVPIPLTNLQTLKLGSGLTVVRFIYLIIYLPGGVVLLSHYWRIPTCDRYTH